MFSIQVGNPRIYTEIEDVSELEDVGEAIEEIFPMETECAHIVWNRVYVPLSYKYDLSVIHYEIMEMLNFLLDSEQGQLTVEFPSDTFNVSWVLSVSEGSLVINSKWNSVSGSIESLLNERSRLELQVDDFVSEWKMLLKKLIDSIPASQIKNKSAHLEGYSELVGIENKILSYGKLYK